MVLDFVTYALYDTDMPNDKILLFHGRGSNGKSQLFRILSALFGDFCLEGSYIIFHEKFEAVQLKNKRLFIMDETPKDTERKTWDMIKSYSSNGNTRGRDLNKSGGTFKTHYRMIMACNDLPNTGGDSSDGLFRRLLIVPLKTQFGLGEGTEEATVSISSEIIKDELPGIFNLLLARADRLKARRFQIDTPQASADAVDEYKRDKDIVRAFVDDMLVYKKINYHLNNGTKFCNLYTTEGRCGYDAKLYSKATDINNAYEKYLKDEGVPDSFKLGRSKLMSRIKAITGLEKKPTTARLFIDHEGSTYHMSQSKSIEGYEIAILMQSKSGDK